MKRLNATVLAGARERVVGSINFADLNRTVDEPTARDNERVQPENAGLGVIDPTCVVSASHVFPRSTGQTMALAMANPRYNFIMVEGRKRKSFEAVHQLPEGVSPRPIRSTRVTTRGGRNRRPSRASCRTVGAILAKTRGTNHT